MSRVKTKKIRLEHVKPLDDNPREASRDVLEGLEESVRRFGYVEPIVWNQHTNRIVGGHQRYRILVKNGVEEATVLVVDMTDEEELAANITLNNPEIEGEWDDSVVDLLSSIEGDDSDLFSKLRLDDLRNTLEGKRPRRNDKGERPGDTTCPCCGHEWDVDEGDVIVS